MYTTAAPRSCAGSGALVAYLSVRASVVPLHTVPYSQASGVHSVSAFLLPGHDPTLIESAGRTHEILHLV